MMRHRRDCTGREVLDHVTAVGPGSGSSSDAISAEPWSSAPTRRPRHDARTALHRRPARDLAGTLGHHRTLRDVWRCGDRSAPS